MPALNTVFIQGNLTRDLEMRFTPSGTALATFAIANTRNSKRGSEWVKETSYIDCKAWGDLAQRLSERLAKGSEVLVSGRLEQERWESDGAKRSRIVIIADRVDVVPARA